MEDVRALHLQLFCVTIFVRDHDESLRFYIDQLGFKLVRDESANGVRWVAVSPPDGSTVLALAIPWAGSPHEKLRGRPTAITFVTEDVERKYEEWSARGVPFSLPPQVQPWSGTLAVFEDPDGNSFSLVGIDSLTRQIEADRRAAAEKQESERRAEQEMEIARQVQTRLFPQMLPAMSTLDYAGLCIQARKVGGDYYDFLPLGPGRLGLVIADVSGKGIAAALLMANLQANLRSQCTIALADLNHLLGCVNRLFCGNTTDSAYATMFFGEYDGGTGMLRYVNCGHLSALLLRGKGGLERLDSTNTVLGMFRDWHCVTAEVAFLPGDALVLYTDGVTEAFNEAGEDFGEERLVELLRVNRERSAQNIAELIAAEVQRFSSAEERGEQHDDITLIVARCLA